MTETLSTLTLVKVNWTNQKCKLKVNLPTLTDADLHFEEGKKVEMDSKMKKNSARHRINCRMK